MRRESILPRPDWQAKVEKLGLLFHQNPDGPYWQESAYYCLSGEEVTTLESATNELHERCLDAVRHVIDHDRFEDLRISEAAVPWIKQSWDADPPAIYGRFDLAFDGIHPPKLLEYNADTPTSLLEAAVIQWHWVQEVFPDADQFNSIWEGLVDKWADLKAEGCLPGNLVHFASVDSVEDYMTISALRDTAAEAGLYTDALLMHQIGWDEKERTFVDLHDRPIRSIFKLYPWEWLVEEAFSKPLFETYATTSWIEPIWKMILSNKGILPILWELFPDHPNLLECYFDEPRGLQEFAQKPLLGREGANIHISTKLGEWDSSGDYTGQRQVFQQYVELPQFDDSNALIGSWVIDGVARGIGIRESEGPITTNLSRFVPHIFG